MTCRWVAPFDCTGCIRDVSRNGTQAVPYGFAGRLYLCAHCSYSAERGTALIHRLWRSPFPEGEGLAWHHSSTQVIFVTLLGDESSPLHCVVSFNRTGYIRYAPGTAHRPFPTVSLVGVCFNQRISKTGTSVSKIIVNCPLSIVNLKITVNYFPLCVKKHRRVLQRRCRRTLRLTGTSSYPRKRFRDRRRWSW